MAVKKSRKRSGFVIYSYFEDSAFTAVKRDAELQPRYVKGVICISSANVANRTYRKGVSFLSKMVYKRVTGGGGASPYKTLLSTPPPRAPGSLEEFKVILRPPYTGKKARN